MSSPICPECNRPLINRRFDRCAYCGVEVPEALRLSDEKKAVLLQQSLDRLEEEKRNKPKFVREYYVSSYIGGGDMGDSGGGGGCDGGAEMVDRANCG